MYENYERILHEKGMKTSDVSRETGLNSTFFSEWKKGKSKSPKVESLLLIARCLGVSLDVLVTGEEITSPNSIEHTPVQKRVIEKILSLDGVDLIYVEGVVDTKLRDAKYTKKSAAV